MSLAPFLHKVQYAYAQGTPKRDSEMATRRRAVRRPKAGTATRSPTAVASKKRPPPVKAKAGTRLKTSAKAKGRTPTKKPLKSKAANRAKTPVKSKRRTLTKKPAKSTAVRRAEKRVKSRSSIPAKKPVQIKADLPAGIPASPPSVHPVTPYLTVADVAASLAFYAQAFGFTPGMTLSSPDGKIIHAAMDYSGALAIQFSPQGIWSGSMQSPAHSGAENPITLHVRCPDVDAMTARARAAGATILSEPADMFWGERIARIADPDGYVWCFATRFGDFDPGKVPEVVEEILPPAAEESPAADLDLEF